MQKVRNEGFKLLLLCSIVYGYSLKPLRSSVVGSLGSLPKLEGISTNVFSQTAVIGALSIIPTQTAMAAEGSAISAVSIPLLISVLIMVPFLYYQQALKPKERTVKQIELDDNLREKDGGNRFGRTSEARAGKRK